MREVEQVARAIYAAFEKTTPEAWGALVAAAADVGLDAEMAADYVADIRAAAIAALDAARGETADERQAMMQQAAKDRAAFDKLGDREKAALLAEADWPRKDDQ
jgi:hypothetical protein